MAAKTAKNTVDQDRKDSNREKKLAALALLQDLLRQAMDTTFTGSVEIVVHAKDGHITRPRETVTRFR